MRAYLVATARGKLGCSRDDAEDLAQQVMLSAWKHRHTFEPRHAGSFTAWLFQMLRNASYSAHRKRISHGEISMTAKSEKGDDFVGDIEVPGAQEGVVELEDTMAALRQLPIEKMDAVILASRGYTYVEMADAIGCPIGTVKSRVCRGRKALKEIVE